MNDSKGFTLLDLLIGLVVIGVIGSIVGGVFFGVLFTPKSIASQSAQSYVDQINGVGGDGAKLIGCLSADNDGDGTVSCNMLNKKTGEQYTMLCESSLWAKFMGGSCKPPRPFTMNQQQQ